MTLEGALVRLVAVCVGVLAMIRLWDWAETQIRFRAVIAAAASTREVVPNVRGDYHG
jgi:lysylphosphatidylglycerol synthetase-like protein (DUF2156 family)